MKEINYAILPEESMGTKLGSALAGLNRDLRSGNPESRLYQNQLALRTILYEVINTHAGAGKFIDQLRTISPDDARIMTDCLASVDRVFPKEEFLGIVEAHTVPHTLVKQKEMFGQLEALYEGRDVSVASEMLALGNRVRYLKGFFYGVGTEGEAREKIAAQADKYRQELLSREGDFLKIEDLPHLLELVEIAEGRNTTHGILYVNWLAREVVAIESTDELANQYLMSRNRWRAIGVGGLIGTALRLFLRG